MEHKPLSARSALLSVLLGAPEEGLTSQQLVRVGDHLGISEATVRVALSRAVAAGELRRRDAAYRLGERLLARRARQDERESRLDWDGGWEVVVVVATGRTAPARAALRSRLAAARLAELREGVWLRPANLARALPGPDDGEWQLLRAEPVPEAAALAARLWDLAAWRREAEETMAALDLPAAPGARLAVAAHLVRLLAADPLLPADLLPAGWPAAEVGARYAAYQRELIAVATGS